MPFPKITRDADGKPQALQVEGSPPATGVKVVKIWKTDPDKVKDLRERMKPSNKR